MGGAAGHHEQMPDAVEVPDAGVERIEYDAQGVEQPARHEPGETGRPQGQPLAPDYYPMNSRTIKLPIEYKKDRKTIRNVLLYVARNGENTWSQEAFVTPDKDAFVYVAKDDGVYWFKMVIEDLKGNKDPADLTRDPRFLPFLPSGVPLPTG